MVLFEFANSLAIIVICICIIILSHDRANAYFIKLDRNAIIPTKRTGDGCYDLYACLKYDIHISPGETKLIPTGIASVIGEGYRIALRERGSNTKWNGQIMAGQVDSNYRGEYFIAVHNCGTKSITLTNIETDKDIIETETDIIVYTKSKALCQFAIEKVPNIKIVEKDIDFLNKHKTERGSGKLGSSGK